MSGNELENFKISLEDWSAKLKLSAEQEMARVSLLGVIQATPSTDKFLMWLLGISGLFISLAFGNLDTLTKAISEQSIRCVLGLVLLSAFIGFVSKIFVVLIEIYKKIAEELPLKIAQVYQNYLVEHSKVDEMAKDIVESPSDILDFSYFLEQYSEPFGCCIKRSIEKSFRKGFEVQ